MRKIQLLGIFLLLSKFIFPQSWQLVQVFPQNNVTGPALLDGTFFIDTGIVMSSYGQIVHSNDFFNSFWIDSTYATKDFSEIFFYDRDTGYISSGDVPGRMLKSFDGGNTWQPLTNAAPSTYLGELLLFITPDTGFSALINPAYFNYTFDGGVNWTETVIEPSEDYPYIFRILYRNGTIYALCDGGTNTAAFGFLTIMQSNDYGVTWSIYSATNIFSTYGDFYFVDDSTVIIVTNQTIYRSTNSGLSFDTVLYSSIGGLIDYQHCFSFCSHDTGFVAFYSDVYKTYDAGATWQETDYPFDSSDYDNRIEFIKAISSQKVIIGCEHGNIYKTITGGGIAAGINEIGSNSQQTIFPNPTTSFIESKNMMYNIRITNIVGQMLFIENGPKSQVDVSGLPAGMYIVNYTYILDPTTYINKFIKQ